MHDNRETPHGRTPEAMGLGPLTERELLVLGAIVNPQDSIELFVRGTCAGVPQIWVATTSQLLMIERDLLMRDALEVPFSQVTGVEVDVGLRGATVRILARGRWHDLDGADHELGRLFAAHVFARCMGKNPAVTGTETRGWQRGSAPSPGTRAINAGASAG